ncbi:MAG: hypothetical protein DUW69_000882 [Verrucomicrobia bacterium]|nr:MAG: hypothetical protein DUW69_000882 [Verrucomicrobiota bacterium]
MKLRHILASFATAVFSLPLAAQTVNLTFQDITPTNPITWNYIPDSLAKNTFVGPLRFTDTGGASLYTFCIDLAQYVNFGGNYTFQYTAVPNAPITSSIGTPMGATKADHLSLLYGSVFGSNLSGYTPLTTLNTAAKRQGFQLAVWNIVFDSVIDWSVTGSAGNFYVSSTDAGSTAAIAQANAYLGAVQTDVAGGGGTRMALIALSDSTAQPGIQDQLLPLGFLVSVPEPASYALLAGGFALAGVLLLRCREQAA